MFVKPLHEPRPILAQEPFLQSIEDVFTRIDAIDPLRYDKTRNYLDGAVTWLSPYITHGVINTQTVASRVMRNNAPKSCYRLLYELAWREYFHRIWQTHASAVFSDMYHPQVGVESQAMPLAIVEACTGVQVLDDGLRTVQQTGWMHNHMRMWVAGATCNLAHTDWKTPARWLYYHLLDGDLASNTLSWQWIAGTFSHKQYIANQDNLNKYSRSKQTGTWLDTDYETLARLPTPDVLKPRLNDDVLLQVVPGESVPAAADNPSEQIALRSLWNLNPFWLNENKGVKHVLFIEQAQVDAWPMAKHRWAFIQHWVEQLDIDVWLGSVEELNLLARAGTTFIREEYPACNHWPGQVMLREFHFEEPSTSYRSFSQFWKQVK